MLIISADDWGRNRVATDAILECFSAGRVSSTGAMLFMNDSARAATLAREAAVDVGLHLNLSEQLSADNVPASVREAHDRVRRFLRLSKYALIIFNPQMRRDFRLVFQAQWEAFEDLYQHSPSHIDGHQHMHLCTNILLQHLIPQTFVVRRSFSFGPGEKNIFNRAYRCVVDHILQQRHQTTDFFFSIAPVLSPTQIAPIIRLAADHLVELMVHPELPKERQFLLSDEFAGCLYGIKMCNYTTARFSAIESRTFADVSG